VIHPTALVHPKAELDSTVEVGPYCVIDANVRVAAGCRLFHNVYLTGWTQIGEQCILHPGVIVGHDPQDTKYAGSKTYCRIGKNTILREYVTIHRGTTPDSSTQVGDDCFLLGGSHVAHNCHVGNRVTLINNALLAGHVEVGDGVTVGGGAGAHQFVRIGELAMIAGNARVSMDVLPFAMIDVDGRVAGLNRVGLRRAGLQREQVESVRQAYRTLYGGGLPFSEAVQQLAGELHAANSSGIHESPTAAMHKARPQPVESIVKFVQSPSRRGIAGRTRKGHPPT